MTTLVRMFEDKSILKFKMVIVDNQGYDISRGYLIINERPDNQGKVGIIEDVWTHPDYRKQGFASEIIQSLLDLAKDHKVYKIILDCSDDNMKLYQKFGFIKWQNSMRKDLP